MKSIFCLICLVYLLCASADETSKEKSNDCFHFSDSDSFFFQIEISGISQNVSCLENCGCYGTDVGYSSQHCRQCCCQNRVLYKDTGRFVCFIHIQFSVDFNDLKVSNVKHKNIFLCFLVIFLFLI